MTAPLDEKAFEIALGCYSEGGCSGLDERERREVVTDIISAYLAASASPSEMEVVAYEHKHMLATNVHDREISESRQHPFGPNAKDVVSESLVTLSQAQSALAAMRAERDEMTEAANSYAHQSANLAAQVLRLTEEKEAILGDFATTAFELVAAEARIKALEQALGNMFCPRPCNHRPDHFDAKDCVAEGECGCGAQALKDNALVGFGWGHGGNVP